MTREDLFDLKKHYEDKCLSGIISVFKTGIDLNNIDGDRNGFEIIERHLSVLKRNLKAIRVLFFSSKFYE